MPRDIEGICGVILMYSGSKAFQTWSAFEQTSTSANSATSHQLQITLISKGDWWVGAIFIQKKGKIDSLNENKYKILN